MSMFVCLSARVTGWKTGSPIFTKFLCMLPIAIARSFSGANVIMSYVLMHICMAIFQFIVERQPKECVYTMLHVACTPRYRHNNHTVSTQASVTGSLRPTRKPILYQRSSYQAVTYTSKWQYLGNML